MKGKPLTRTREEFETSLQELSWGGWFKELVRLCEAAPESMRGNVFEEHLITAWEESNDPHVIDELEKLVRMKGVSEKALLKAVEFSLGHLDTRNALALLERDDLSRKCREDAWLLVLDHAFEEEIRNGDVLAIGDFLGFDDVQERERDVIIAAIMKAFEHYEYSFDSDSDPEPYRAASDIAEDGEMPLIAREKAIEVCAKHGGIRKIIEYATGVDLPAELSEKARALLRNAAESEDAALHDMIFAVDSELFRKFLGESFVLGFVKVIETEIERSSRDELGYLKRSISSGETPDPDGKWKRLVSSKLEKLNEAEAERRPFKSRNIKEKNIHDAMAYLAQIKEGTMGEPRLGGPARESVKGPKKRAVR